MPRKGKAKKKAARRRESAPPDAAKPPPWKKAGPGPPGIPPVLPQPLPTAPRGGDEFLAAALVAPAAGSLLLPAAAVGGLWVQDAVTQLAVGAGPLAVASVVETTTLDACGVTDGTALLWVDRCYAPDADGVFFDATCCGASSATRAAELDAFFNGPGAGVAIAHLCCSGRGACPATVLGRRILHLDCFRVMPPSSIIEGWARLAVILAGSAELPEASNGVTVLTTPDMERVQRHIINLKRL